MNTSKTTGESSTGEELSGKWLDHNSWEFHEKFMKPSPDGEYRNQLRTARRVAAKGIVSPADAAKVYQVRVEDIISNVPIEQIVRMDYAQNSPKT